MSISQKIRDYLATQPHPLKGIEIRKALDLPRAQVNCALSELTRKGMLVRIETHRPFRFKLGREMKHPRYTSDEERAAARQAVRKRAWVKAQEKAKARRAADGKAQARAELLAARRAAKAAEKQARERRRMEQVRAAEEKRTAARQAQLAKLAARAVKQTKPAEVDTREAETVEAFLARGGRIQRLHIHEVSQPLRFIGHRAINERTWREREAA
jgi:hypothetical protein